MKSFRYLLAALLFVSASSTLKPVDTKVAQQNAATPVNEEESEPNDVSSPEEIAEWIGDLSSSSFQSRRESFVKLWRTGKSALSAVQAAMQSADKQQAETAATLEVLIRLNVTLDDPAEAANLLNELTTSPELALVKLCKRGYWSVAHQLLELNSDLLQSFKSSPSAYSRMNALVDEALEQDKIELAWPVVRQVLPYQQALWIALRHDLEPPAMDAADPTLQAWTLYIKGDYAGMLQSAAAAELKADLAMRAFQWEAFRDPSVMKGIVGTRSSAGQKASTALMLEFAGQLSESESVWSTVFPDGISFNSEKPDSETPGSEKTDSPESDETDWAELSAKLRAEQIQTDRTTLDTLAKLMADPPNLERVLLAMICSGRVQAVQDFLLEQSHKDAWGLSSLRSDHAAAFASKGLKPDLSNFDEWLVKRKSELNNSANQFFDELNDFRSGVEQAMGLQSLGQAEQADKLFDVLVSVCNVSRQRSANYWFAFATSMTRGEFRHRMLQILAANQQKIDEKNREQILSVLYPECETSVAVLFDLAPEINDEQGRPSKWEALEQLYRFNRQRFEPNSSKVLTAWLRRVRNNLSASDELSSMQLGELAKLADGIGHPELALEFARESGQASIDLWAYAGQTLQQRGELKNAIEYFSAIRRMDSGRQEAIVDEANALMMLGQVSEATELQKSRWLRPLMIYGAASWYSVGKRLNDDNRFALAKEYIEPAFLLFGCDDLESNAMQQPIFAVITSEYIGTADDLEDVELSANLNRALLTSLISTRRSRGYPAATYASLASKERTQWAVLAARRGDLAAFERHAAVAESALPLGITLVEDSYHELVATGNQATAEKWFKRYEQRLLEHLARWPKDASSHNNLAWMYARCNLKLEEALEHSQTAVELSPHSAVLLDTLAEVQFRLNQYSAAVNSMQRCIQLDPRDPHLRKQLERFLKAELEHRK